MINPTVFIVDDDAAVRDSLRYLLESAELEVEEFSSAESFLKTYSPYRVGCLLLDIRMPGMGGIKLLEKLAVRKFFLPIIIITGHGDVSLAVRSIKTGAFDFLEKPFNTDDVLARVNAGIALDKQYRHERLAYDAIEARVSNLTPREKQVLDLVIHDNSNKEIAHQLGVSIKTVEFHRARVMEKMHADSLLHLSQMVRNVLTEEQQRVVS
jgi:FixJ family two-component response regulator